MGLNKISINNTTTVNTGIIYDISKATGQSYENLSDALSGNNVPLEVREGGMSVRFVQTSDNKYVQYRLMSSAWNTNVANWQGVDDEPTINSNNLVKSEGVFYNTINRSRKEINITGIFDNESSLYISDSNGNVIAQIGQDGIKAIDFLNKSGESIISSHNNFDYIIDDYNDKLYITDYYGNIVFYIDKSGIHSINENKFLNLFNNKNVWSLGDSLSEGGYWQKKF